jgi:Cu2+-containing amine oxidase
MLLRVMDRFASQLLPLQAGGPSLSNRDLVVWYKGSLHHHPRSEDGVYGKDHGWVGTADVMWTGFMLVPHDFFDCSPLYKPCP